jgi:hypothetical protein
MGLINLQTDLKSLKFGKDRPGGGSSKQPYIQKPISDNPQGNTGGTDFILRGGLKAPQRALEDVARLTKYIADGSKGILYTAKENLLSRMSVGTETSKGPAYAAGALNAGAYTPLSTLAQAGVGFAGTHLNKMGIDPTGLLPGLSLNKYETIVKDNNKIKNNKLEIVKGKEITIPGIPTPIFLPDKLKGNVDNRLLKIYKDKQFTFSLNNNTVLEYGGGPGSILGVGKTRIRFADQRTGQNNTDLSNSGFFSEGFRVFKHTNAKTRTFDRIDYRNYLGASTEQGISLKENGINDSGQLTYESGDPNKIFDESKKSDVDLNKKFFKEDSKNPHNPIEETEFKTYKNTTLANLYKGNKSFKTGINIENRVNLGDPGNVIGSFNPDSTPLDKINASRIYTSTSGNNGRNSGEYNDLVHFRIGVINPNLPSETTYMNFRSYIDSFSDSYSSDWKAQSYMGRGEKFYKYGGFDRSISMAFTVVAQSFQEMRGMYQKLNFLASSLAPTYTTEGYMAGNLVKMTVGDYIYEQVGFISSITYDIPQESSWDLSLESTNLTIQREKTDNPDELPLMIKVTGLKFTPIHKFRPEIAKKGQNNEPRYITNKLNLEGYNAKT